MGSKGEVTEQLATMLKSLWSLQYDPEISIRFKSLVDKHASQYKGGRQHDAQEFLLWLLDQVWFYKFELDSKSLLKRKTKKGILSDHFAHYIDMIGSRRSEYSFKTQQKS